MPKVIKDANMTIKNCAMDLFIEYGYPNVDMKMISVKSGIAVGTIYHYYKNKQQLYLCVLSESWGKTFTKLDKIGSLDCTSNEKLYKLIATLYQDIKDRRGLGKVLFDNSIEELQKNTSFSELRNSLVLRVNGIMVNLYKGNNNAQLKENATKLTETLLVSIGAMIEFHPNDDNNNIDFLRQLFSASV